MSGIIKKTWDFLCRSSVLRLLAVIGGKKNMSPDAAIDKRIQRIAFLRPGKLGDLIVATPFFSQLKKNYPSLHIAVICSPYNRIVIKHNPYIDEIKVVNFHSVFAVFGLIGWIRKKKFDWLIDLIPGASRTSAIIARLVRSERTATAGMHKGDVKKFYDINTDFRDIHIIDRNRLLIESVMNCRFSDPVSTEMHVLPEHLNKAEQILGSVRNCVVIGINCSAGEIERQWKKENYRKLMEMISAKCNDVHTVLFSVNEQYEWAVELSNEFRNTTALPRLDIFTVAAAMKHLSVFFSPDTSLIHIASANRYPVIGLYCTDGENLVRWRAYGSLTRELVALETHDVNEIRPDQAFDAIYEIIEIIKRGK